MIISPLAYYGLVREFGKGFRQEAALILSDFRIDVRRLVVVSTFQGRYFGCLLPDRKHIAISSDWIVLLVRSKDLRDLNAFKRLIGHEQGHIYVQKHVQNPSKDQNAWAKVEEVYADFYSGAQSLDCNRASLVAALQRVVELKMRSKHWKDRMNSSHPSFAQRILYAQRFDWSDDLIKRILLDAGYVATNDLIDNIVTAFPPLPHLK